MITPYWADLDLKYGGNVFYRQTTDTIIIEKASVQIKNSFHSFNNAQFNWAFIITWSNISFFGLSECPNANKRDTFQLVLVSDGSHSFAIFNYNLIEWTTGRASRGDCEGLNGTQAKAGFDAGDTIHYYMIQDSCTPNIINIASQSNVGVPGRFIFRVDDAEIITPTPLPTTPSTPSTTSTTSTPPPPRTTTKDCIYFDILDR